MQSEAWAYSTPLPKVSIEGLVDPAAALLAPSGVVNRGEYPGIRGTAAALAFGQAESGSALSFQARPLAIAIIPLSPRVSHSGALFVPKSVPHWFPVGSPETGGLERPDERKTPFTVSRRSIPAISAVNLDARPCPSGELRISVPRWFPAGSHQASSWSVGLVGFVGRFRSDRKANPPLHFLESRLQVVFVFQLAGTVPPNPRNPRASTGSKYVGSPLVPRSVTGVLYS